MKSATSNTSTVRSAKPRRRITSWGRSDKGGRVVKVAECEFLVSKIETLPYYQKDRYGKRSIVEMNPVFPQKDDLMFDSTVKIVVDDDAIAAIFAKVLDRQVGSVPLSPRLKVTVSLLEESAKELAPLGASVVE